MYFGISIVYSYRKLFIFICVLGLDFVDFLFMGKLINRCLNCDDVMFVDVIYIDVMEFVVMKGKLIIVWNLIYVVLYKFVFGWIYFLY